jgi:hypothetical protein
MGRVLGALLAVALAVPATAAAGERRLTVPFATGLQADGGWTVWHQNDPTFPRGVVRWRRDGHTVKSSAPLGAMGIGADGKAVVVDTRCAKRNRCTVNERPAASRKSRRLLSTRFAARDADEYRGTVAVSGPGVYVRRRGQRRLVRVDSLPGLNVSVGNGFLVYRADKDGKYLVRLVDFRGRRPRARTIAIDDQFDEDCKCTMSVTSITDIAAEDSYVYWMQNTITSTDDNPIGTGGSFDATTDIFRARTTDPRQVEVLRTSRWGRELAVDGHRVFYTGATRGVFQVDRPDWQPVAQPQT